jgi:hypothetical protein
MKSSVSELCCASAGGNTSHLSEQTSAPSANVPQTATINMLKFAEDQQVSYKFHLVSGMVTPVLNAAS